MITIEDIKNDLKVTNESDAYYYDCIDEVGYHLHEDNNGKCLFMKNTGKQIRPITEGEFIHAVNNKCHGNSISANYYFTFKH